MIRLRSRRHPERTGNFFDPSRGERRRRSAALLLLFALLVPASAHAQGCSQCRDNTAATPPSTQRAYRHAIALLALTATGIFVATVTLIRRNR